MRFSCLAVAASLVMVGACADVEEVRPDAPAFPSPAPRVAEPGDPSAGLDLAIAVEVFRPQPKPRASRSASRPRAVAPARPVEPAGGAGGWRSLGVFSSTCYELTGRTATGRQAGPGSVAVDPRVIPLGSRLRVEGYGEGIAADTGSAIKGRIVDVWKASGCAAWGRRAVVVEVFEQAS